MPFGNKRWWRIEKKFSFPRTYLHLIYKLWNAYFLHTYVVNKLIKCVNDYLSSFMVWYLSSFLPSSFYCNNKYQLFITWSQFIHYGYKNVSNKKWFLCVTAATWNILELTFFHKPDVEVIQKNGTDHFSRHMFNIWLYQHGRIRARYRLWSG